MDGLLSDYTEVHLMASCAAAGASTWIGVPVRDGVCCRYPKTQKKKKKKSEKSCRQTLPTILPELDVHGAALHGEGKAKGREAYSTTPLVRLRVPQFFHVGSALHLRGVGHAGPSLARLSASACLRAISAAGGEFTRD